MDVTTIMLWAIVIGLGYLGWRWHKQGRSLEELARSIQRVLRRGLSAADTEEVKAIQTRYSLQPLSAFQGKQAPAASSETK